MMEMELLSPAKVNLFLKVLKKREDGYHDILSLMQPVSLFDIISISITEGDSITVNVINSVGAEGSVPSGPENLAYKAAKLFLESAGLKRAVTIEINKHIPSAAGLGGGSSNAATVLMGLNEALGMIIDHDELMVLSMKLGSDVPFFLLKGSALASGRGEVLERISFPLYDYVLVNPGFEVSSGWAYENLGLTKKDEDNMLLYSKSALMDNRRIEDLLSNDLEPVVLKKYPRILDLKNELLDTGALGALMTGSGPTVFGVYSDADSAKSALKRIEGKLEAPAKAFLVRGGS
jgi:4-diphosphocytidyl-2-C-methyl-D-erythritol kinase